MSKSEKKDALERMLEELPFLTPEELYALLDRVEARQQELGDVFGQAAPPRYRDPNDPKRVFFGEGKAPAWFVEHQKRGIPISELINPRYLAFRDKQQGGPYIYQDPENPLHVWDGKRWRDGRIPQKTAGWLVDYLAAGRSLQEFINPKWLEVDARKRKRSIKYRDPENPLHVWSGVGRMPHWVRERLDGGGSLEELKVTA